MIKIAIADDQALIRESLRVVLNINPDMEVAGVAANGVQLLQLLEKQAVDVILMDVRMPYMDGLTATQRIRASGKSDAETIPILAMTANAYEADIKKSLAAGMNAHLTKPVDAKRICKAIQKALDGELNN